jgi:hypothetical protein
MFIPENFMGEDMGLVLRTLLKQWASYLLDSCRREESPGDDKTGKLQKERQTKNSDVWFVPGSFGNKDTITRNDIEIPAGRKLFIVAASADASTAEPPYNKDTPPEKLRRGAKAILNEFNEAYVQIDGQKYSKDDGLTQVVTEPFEIRFVDGNPYDKEYGVKAGRATMVCAALVAYVEPLTEGPHKITVYSRRGDDEFQVNVIHDVKVVPLTDIATA